MKSLLLVMLCIACSLLTGCSPTTASSMTDIYPGMTKDEVYDELGKPDKVRKLDATTEVLKYELCISECWRVPGFRENEIYFIDIEGGKVVQWHERRASEGRKPTQNYLPRVDPSVMQPKQTVQPVQPAMDRQQPTKTNCRQQYDGSMECTTQQGGGLYHPDAFRINQ